MIAASTSALHITPGHSSAGGVKIALRLPRARVIPNLDPLAYGPVRGVTDLHDWITEREAYLRTLHEHWTHTEFEHFAAGGLTRNLERLRDAESLVVWVATGLEEQLLLAWLVSFADELGIDVASMLVVQFEHLRPGQRVRRMGELSADDIRGFAPTPRALSRRAQDEYRMAWQAYTAPVPDNMIRFLERKDPASAPLHCALKRLVYRFPDAASGLSYCDEMLLRFTRDKGPGAARIVGYAIGYNGTEDYLGDQYVFGRLLALGGSGLASPLLDIAGDTRTMRTCEARLTAFGQSVLAGNANAIAENGIDDWVGGVHLLGSRPAAHRRDDSLVV